MSSPITVQVATSIAAIDPAAWDRCANPPCPGATDAAGADASGERHNPFLSHAFLKALETSGCVGGRSGWSPAHVAVEEDGHVVAVAPTYIKAHSQGEYVFDHSWADAYGRAGGRYYPKLQVAVPFTPATGRRFLVAPDHDAEHGRRALAAGLDALRREVKASSTHATFVTRDEWDSLGAQGWLQRTDQQFHFVNEGYAAFDDFLGALASRKRKNIRKERESALENGITVEHVTGADITEAHWDSFFAFYMDTGSRKWGRPYLNRRFFSEIGAAMADRILLVMARRAGRYVAGAINFIGDDALYGRNWGCIEEHPFLHFEVCYYQAIDFALSRGLARVEAGAQGEHKLARGYRPTTTYSVHDVADPRLAAAIGDYLERERAHVASAVEELGEHLPFRHED